MTCPIGNGDVIMMMEMVTVEVILKCCACLHRLSLGQYGNTIHWQLAM